MQDLANRMKDPTIGRSTARCCYELELVLEAIHILVSMSGISKCWESLRNGLSLSPVFVEMCLKRLEEFGLVRLEKGRWRIAGGSLHLPKNSPVNSSSTFQLAYARRNGFASPDR